MFFNLPSEGLGFYDYKMQSEKTLPFLNCDPKNEQKSFNCIQKYLASKLNCTFPWLKKHSRKGFKQCSKSSELKQHIETYLKVLQRKLDVDIKAFGCLKKNCIENKWKAELFTHQTYDELAGSPLYQEYTEEGKSAIILTTISNEVSNTQS